MASAAIVDPNFVQGSFLTHTDTASSFDSRFSEDAFYKDIGPLESRREIVDCFDLRSSLDISKETSFSDDSFLLQTRPAPSLDYFNNLPSPVERLESIEEPTATTDGPAKEEPKAKETPVPEMVQEAEIIYINNDEERIRPLGEKEVGRMSHRAELRERKARRYAEKKAQAKDGTLPSVTGAPVTYVKSRNEIVFSEPPEYMRYWWYHKRGVAPGNAVKILVKDNKYVVGVVVGVADDRSRLAISWTGRYERIFTRVFAYDSPEWYPVRISKPNNSARYHSYDDDVRSYSSVSYSSSSYGSRPSGSSGGGGDGGGGFSSSSTETTKPRPVIRSKTKNRPASPSAQDLPPKRFHFDPKANHHEGEDEMEPLDDYALKKLEKQHRAQQKHAQFLSELAKRSGQAPLFQYKIVIPERQHQSHEESCESGDEEDMASVPVLTSAVEYADSPAEPTDKFAYDKPSHSVFFEMVDSSAFGMLGADEKATQAFLASAGSSQNIFFSEVDERSRALFDEYIQSALEDALRVSSDSSVSEDFFMQGSLSSSLANSMELDVDTLMLSRSGTFSESEELSTTVAVEDFIVDGEDPDRIKLLNSGLINAEENGGYALSDIAEHYSSFASAPAKKRRAPDVLSHPVTSNERSLVVDTRAASAEISVLDHRGDISQILQPRILSQNDTISSIVNLDYERAGGMFDIQVDTGRSSDFKFVTEDFLASIYLEPMTVASQSNELVFVNPTGGMANEEISTESDAGSPNALDSSTDVETELPPASQCDEGVEDDESPSSPRPERSTLGGRGGRSSRGGRSISGEPSPVPNRDDSFSSRGARGGRGGFGVRQVAPTPYHESYRCEVCNQGFRQVNLWSDHMSSRAHRHQEWLSKHKPHQEDH